MMPIQGTTAEAAHATSLVMTTNSGELTSLSVVSLFARADTAMAPHCQQSTRLYDSVKSVKV
jgi:hypothetical protein